MVVKTMSKRHYEAIAKIINGYFGTISEMRNAKRGISELLAYYFEKDNPLFKKDLFLKKCGVEE